MMVMLNTGKKSITWWGAKHAFTQTHWKLLKGLSFSVWGNISHCAESSLNHFAWHWREYHLGIKMTWVKVKDVKVQLLQLQVNKNGALFSSNRKLRILEIMYQFWLQKMSNFICILSLWKCYIWNNCTYPNPNCPLTFNKH